MTKFLCGECIHNSDKGGGCLIPKNLGYVDNCNHYLPKDRPIVQTNEEWFASLPTEEKAEFSMRVFKNCAWCLDGGSPKECPFNEFLNCPAESKENMMKWLKEEHNDSM